MTTPAVWRIGQHYGIHVYEGDRPVATFFKTSDAELAVAAVNVALDRRSRAERDKEGD